MKVFKFGGASVKSAAAIVNMCEIIKSYQSTPMVVVVSAMGKSTNALEALLDLAQSQQSWSSAFDNFKSYHEKIVSELFKENAEDYSDKARLAMAACFEQLEKQLTECNNTSFAQAYDSIVSFGELLSTVIISHFLHSQGCTIEWTDARLLIKTDDTFQDGKINWEASTAAIANAIDLNKTYITQGFIGSTLQGDTTTLGREGSDFTAAIFAACLDAESVTIWKDVPGILNGDPKIIADAVLFDELPYNEASEMTYYGAKVIHPKTIKPLANKQIPLLVRCFETPDTAGTIIHECAMAQTVPVVIYKDNQCLLSFKSKDLAFVNEQGMSIIFDALHQLDIVINIMQNSAISFSVCIDYHKHKLDALIEKLESEFSILYNTDLQLITIKNYSEEALQKYRPTGQPLLEQVSRNNYRTLIASNS